MIARLPFQLPDPDKGFAVILGSEGSWQGAAARELERSFACVCRTDCQLGPKAVNPLQLASILTELLSVAQAVVVWLDDGPCWALVEIGRVIERHPDRLACGVAPDPSWCWAGSVKYHVQSRGFPVWQSIPDLLTAARQMGRQERQR